MSLRAKRKGRDTVAVPERIARGLLGVSAVTNRITKPVLSKRGFVAGDIVSRWHEIVGVELAAASIPERIQLERGARSNGTLHLRVASGAAAALIHPQLPLIMERINGFLGAGTVSQVRVIQAPLPNRIVRKPIPRARPLTAEALAEADTQIGALDSDPLRQALARLGARLKERK